MAEFDFQEYIPKAELATEATDAKHKRIVCRFWLNGECIKDQGCKFLHVFDLSRMPECRWGAKCQKKGCVFKHTPDEEKDECVNYRLGFCSFGPVCKFRHVLRPASDLTPISEMWTPEYYGEQRSRAKIAADPSTWRVSMCPVIEKAGWCSFFDQCSYAHVPEQLRQPSYGGANKRQRDDGGGGGQDRDGVKRGRYEGGAGSGASSGGAASSSAPSSGGGGSGGFVPSASVPNAHMKRLLEEHAAEAEALELPDADGVDLLQPAGAATGGDAGGPKTRYFAVRSGSANDLAVSLKRGEWITTHAASKRLLAAMQSGAQVLILFSVVHSQHFQGLARVRAPPEPLAASVPLSGVISDRLAAMADAPPAGATQLQQAAAQQQSATLAAARAAGAADRPIAHGDCVAIPIEWLRTCALPFAQTAGVVNTLSVPHAHAKDAALAAGALLSAPQVARSGDWQELDVGAGRCLTLLLYKVPNITVMLDAISAKAAFGVFTAESVAGREALESEAMPPEVEAAEREQAEAHARRTAQQTALLNAMASGLPPSAAMMMLGRSDGMPGGPGGGVGDTGAAARKGLPPILVLPSLPGGAPANPYIAGLLSGVHPGPGAPPPAVIAADAWVAGQAGYMFGVNNVTGDMCLESGVLAAPDDFADAVRMIAPGTPILVFHIHQRQLYGLYTARTPAVRDLVPKGTFPTMRGGGRDGEQQSSSAAAAAAKKTTSFPFQCQTLCVAPAPPMPQAAFAPVLGQRPQPGPLAPGQMHAIAVQMFSMLPPHTVLRIAGLLLQMQAVGMPKLNLLGPPPGLPGAPAGPAGYGSEGGRAAGGVGGGVGDAAGGALGSSRGGGAYPAGPGSAADPSLHAGGGDAYATAAHQHPHAPHDARDGHAHVGRDAAAGPGEVEGVGAGFGAGGSAGEAAPGGAHMQEDDAHYPAAEQVSQTGPYGGTEAGAGDSGAPAAPRGAAEAAATSAGDYDFF